MASGEVDQKTDGSEAGENSDPRPLVYLHNALIEGLNLESKYQPALALPNTTKDCSEISMRMRNGSAHVLRCLKVWYDLPPDIFFHAVNVMDRFLTCMKAQPKHLACIAVSAFHLACQHASTVTNFGPGSTDWPIMVPDRQDLTTISQCKCGPGDVARMEKIITEKLSNVLQVQPPVTSLTMLRILHIAHAHLAAPLIAGEEGITEEDAMTTFPSLTSLTHKLEIIACDSASTIFLPSVVAITLLTLELENSKYKSYHMAVMRYLFGLCSVRYDKFNDCRAAVKELMDQYNNQRHSPHRQRLVWKLSNRTLRQLRPTDKFKSRLPTISELQPRPHPFFRLRSQKDSVDSMSSEEEMDFDYDEEFPPLPPPTQVLHTRSPLKSATNSPHKKQTQKFPYPKVGNRKHGRSA